MQHTKPDPQALLFGAEKVALRVLEGIIPGAYSGGSKRCGGPTKIKPGQRLRQKSMIGLQTHLRAN